MDCKCHWRVRYTSAACVRPSKTLRIAASAFCDGAGRHVPRREGYYNVSHLQEVEGEVMGPARLRRCAGTASTKLHRSPLLGLSEMKVERFSAIRRRSGLYTRAQLNSDYSVLAAPSVQSQYTRQHDEICGRTAKRRGPRLVASLLLDCRTAQCVFLHMPSIL